MPLKYNKMYLKSYLGVEIHYIYTWARGVLVLCFLSIEKHQNSQQVKSTVILMSRNIMEWSSKMPKHLSLHYMRDSI